MPDHPRKGGRSATSSYVVSGGVDDELDVVAFARSLQQFFERMTALAPSPVNLLLSRLRAHLGVEDPSQLPAVRDQLVPAEHVNLQLALDRFFEDTPCEIIGLSPEMEHYGGFSLARMVSADAHFPMSASSAAYVDLPVGPNQTRPCLLLGLLLFHVDAAPVLALVRRSEQHGPPTLLLEVMSTDEATASQFLREIAGLREELNAFRGRVLSFEFGEWGQFGLAFHALPVIGRDDVVLPDDDLVAIERHTVGLARHAPALVAAGHHLKRGLLLYGPPGTGKTFTVMYLCNRMPGRTTVLLAGVGDEMLGQAVALARKLQPAMVVLEDVDLVAFERTMHPTGQNPLLFQLLNEMDGLEADADVIFVLTTNRPELLEPALAQRPGRIDQAVEIRLPDDECRRRLLAHYFRAVPLRDVDLDALIADTEGVPAAFIKELARRSTLEALEHGEVSVRREHIDAALAELSRRTRALLDQSPGASHLLVEEDDVAPGGDGASCHVPYRGW